MLRHIRTTTALTAVALLLSLTSSAAAAPKKGELVNKNGQQVKGNISLKEVTGFEPTIETVESKWVKCKTASATATMEANSTMSGKITNMTLTGCRTGVTEAKCKNTGVAGEIATGELHIEVTRTESKEADLVLTTLTKELTIECEGGITVKVKGEFLSNVKKEELLTTKFTLLANSTKAGVQEFVKYTNLAGTVETARIEANFGGGFRETAENSELAMETAEEAKFI